MKIKAETVEQIKHATDIIEVIGDYVSLKKRGANYQACCPFHNEKTPSFSVNPVRQIFKCFGCGAAGDAIKFVMDIDGIGYSEALKHLAQKYNIEIKEEELPDEEALQQNERESLFIVLGFARTFFQEQLKQSDEGRAIGLSYFRERGFSDLTVDKFELGYSPEVWDALAKAAKIKGYSDELLEKAGLIIKREGTESVFDRFRGRVMFPIHNISGKVIAFGGRILKNDKKSAKYINSPETAVYHKSDVLYGIYQAKNAIRQTDQCYLVEGYTDVISLHQGGVENVVASSGTSLTIEQIRLISRFTRNVTILYDGDAAGIKAALRGLDMVLEEDMNVSIVTFPDNDDPDSYMRKVGATRFQEYLKTASKDFITFKTEVLIDEAGNDPFKQAELITDIVSSIVKIPDAIKRQVFFNRVSERLKIDEQVLITEGNKLVRKIAAQKQKEKDREALRKTGSTESTPEFPPDDLFGPDAGDSEIPVSFKREEAETTSVGSRIFHEESCVRLLILFGGVELEPGITVSHYIVQETMDTVFVEPKYSTVIEVCREKIRRGESLDTDFFVHHSDKRIKDLAIHYLSPKYEVSNLWFEKHEIYVPSEQDVLEKSSIQAIFRLVKASLDEELRRLNDKLKQHLSDDECDQVMRDYMDVKAKSMLVAKELGIVLG